ncbi:hypothetical protein C942_02716 [Photobacterium marinum]|uniref:Uncharacterized protein n=1 Tax=Photobacterium marinum TaxID=1056511 RepID=L8JG22_9GAMM|nr:MULTISPECIES: hypothetical protein [Photobacterium]ELR67208.1 hypothetical protein C942_02716 [Photobacterium marinum]
MTAINPTAGVTGTTFNPSAASLDSLMMMVMMDRSNLLDSQVRDKIENINAKNEDLKEINGVMSQLRNDMSKVGTDDDDTGSLSPEVEDYLAANFSDFNRSDSYNRKTMQLQLENLKGKAESLTSSSQLDMAQLQSTMGKYNNSFEMLSNFVSKYGQSIDSIVGNLR